MKGLIDKIKEFMGFASKENYEIKFFRVDENRLQVKRFDRLTGNEVPYEDGKKYFVRVLTEGTYSY